MVKYFSSAFMPLLLNQRQLPNSKYVNGTFTQQHYMQKTYILGTTIPKLLHSKLPLSFIYSLPLYVLIAHDYPVPR